MRAYSQVTIVSSILHHFILLYLALIAVIHPALIAVIHPALIAVIHPALIAVIHPALIAVIHPALIAVIHPALIAVIHPALIAVIHPALIAVKHRAPRPHSGAVHSSPRDSKPHMAALLPPHYAVSCNFFSCNQRDTLRLPARQTRGFLSRKSY